MERSFATSVFLAIGALTLSAFAASALASDDVYYNVRGDRLRCLLNNSERYLSMPDNLLVIAVDLCPDISKDPFLEATRNANISLPPIEADGALDFLIAITKAELRCLAKNAAVNEESVYQIVPTSCKIVELGKKVKR